MRCRVRRLKGICLAPLVLLVMVAALSLSVDGAGAANTRVSISNFAWSNEPGIDLGESVTWDWIGPDTAHSVTGTGPGGVFIDSDPDSPFPDRLPGDTFTVAEIVVEGGNRDTACPSDVVDAQAGLSLALDLGDGNIDDPGHRRNGGGRRGLHETRF